MYYTYYTYSNFSCKCAHLLKYHSYLLDFQSVICPPGRGNKYMTVCLGMKTG